ncbi:MAG: type II toxin-antitoxin system prevent-host-death family antitoxin [Pseudonocardiaceae bacterium]|nr:MAG: type II toxin-antitoxin system prevent-host-death family antitoxin [Pseudonocardiaceae bacterium]
MSETISQRDLRNDNAEIMRRVEAGETFTVTRNGKPVAEIVPLAVPRPRVTVGEAMRLLAELPPIDPEQWRREREADDEIFGPDDIDA